MLTLPPMPTRPGDRLTCAISGGADSTALLLLLHAARARLGIGLSAVHINHQLRGADSDADQSFVQALCDRLEIPLHLTRAEPPAVNVEDAARTQRYQAFERLLAEDRTNAILTAHTLDDQAETVLLKLLRGAWLEGLSAIAPVLPLGAGRVLRPLLGTRRDALRDYLQQQNQPWQEDASNADPAFTRNRIRHTVLPLLRQENPQLDHTLANLADLAREEEAHWQAELPRLLPHLLLPGKPVRGGGRSNSTAPGAQALSIELDRLRALSAAVRRRVVRAAARQLGARLSFDETVRLLTLAGFPPALPDPTVPTKIGGRLQLSHGLLAERSARELRLSIA